MDNGIGDRLVNWKAFHDISREFRKRFYWWEWQKMTKRLHDERWWKCGWSKHYVGITCILEPLNPPTPWRHVSFLTMSNFDAYMHKLMEFERCPHSPLSMQAQWIMALVVGFLNGWHFKRVSTKIPLMRMENDDNDTTWWTLIMKILMISNIMRAQHASLSLESQPHHEGICLI